MSYEPGKAKRVSLPHRVRRSGGGRKKKVDRDPQLLSALESLVEPATRGDPESALRWTVKSLRGLSQELSPMGHEVSRNVVSRMLRTLGYSLQGNSKQLEGSHHPDRNAQFEHINTRSAQQLAQGNPVLSVDTKKKELVGSFKNAGREVRPKGSPEKVQVHDFTDCELGKANPYGVYDIGDNSGWVSVGISSDTAAFAVESIRRWWKASGGSDSPSRPLRSVCSCTTSRPSPQDASLGAIRPWPTFSDVPRPRC